MTAYIGFQLSGWGGGLYRGKTCTRSFGHMTHRHCGQYSCVRSRRHTTIIV
ncbi:hypothetical protein J6590_031166 [Homalodisca vitripennis]|nr:hypothetical protein J6590_031166 [Homalodisca vitripennis]